MKLFPAGTITAATNFGTIDNISYKIFEPNAGCKSNPVYNILVTRFKDQILQSRKKSSQYLVINYSYKSIFNKEYEQIEHFVESVDEALTSFYVADFSKGQSVDAVASSAGTWTVHLDNTRLYSSTANYKANKAMLWTGKKWKLGNVTSLTTNASIQLDVGTNNYGALSNTEASTDGLIYPVYEVYMQPNQLVSFTTETYIDAKINLNNVGGFTRSGTMSFVTKYKV
ncbi:MAG: hypothetical protein DRO67_06330 [Candidatus Asgardarchaeum californiense]|nr:MAG: hypothetical protein DRO67_06330 [Candidatus Asgardarchaeum californiense]